MCKVDIFSEYHPWFHDSARVIDFEQFFLTRLNIFYIINLLIYRGYDVHKCFKWSKCARLVHIQLYIFLTWSYHLCCLQWSNKSEIQISPPWSSAPCWSLFVWTQCNSTEEWLPTGPDPKPNQKTQQSRNSQIRQKIYYSMQLSNSSNTKHCFKVKHIAKLCNWIVKV